LGVAVAAGAGLAGCAESTGFDSDAYCAALAQEAKTVDGTAMLDGDPDALEAARAVYADLQALAPPELTAQWALMVRDLDEMVSAARGGTKASDVDYMGFSDAFTAIEQDRRQRCETED
jgi:hypothetical protein